MICKHDLATPVLINLHAYEELIHMLARNMPHQYPFMLITHLNKLHPHNTKILLTTTPKYYLYYNYVNLLHPDHATPVFDHTKLQYVYY